MKVYNEDMSNIEEAGNKSVFTRRIITFLSVAVVVVLLLIGVQLNVTKNNQVASVGAQQLIQDDAQQCSCLEGRKRGVSYSQPGAFNYQLDHMDIELAKKDLDELATACFNQVSIFVNWGDIIASYDIDKEQVTVNQEGIDTFTAFLTEAEKRDIKVVYTISTAAHAPTGVPGGRKINRYTDTAGNVYPEGYGYIDDAFVNPDAQIPLRAFAEELGRLSIGFSNIAYYNLNQESIYYDYKWGRNNGHVKGLFVEYLKSVNGDISHWAERWNREYTKWSNVEMPAMDNKRWAKYWKRFEDGGSFADSGVIPFKANQAHFGDFFRFWYQYALSDNVQSGFSIKDWSDAIKKYDPDGRLSVKHIRMFWFDFWTDLTTKELRQFINLGDIAGIGHYPRNESEFNGHVLISEIEIISALTDHPLVIAESGMSMYDGWTEQQQAEWVDTVDAVASQYSDVVESYNIWLYRDGFAKAGAEPGRPHLFGLKDVEGNPKLAFTNAIDVCRE